ncbi:MAG: UPF0182 family protein [Promethearchaeota archaeon]
MSYKFDEWKDKMDKFKIKYRRFKNLSRKVKLTILIVIIISIILAIALWAWPSWFADINLQTQLYNNKAESNFLNIHFLNFWSTNFFFNKTCLIGGIIGCIIMITPPDRTLLTFINKKLGRGEVSLLKASLFWGISGFILFYLFGFFLNSGNRFALTIYLIEDGNLKLSPTILTDAFNVIFNINNNDYITVYIYSNLIFPIISFIFGVVIFRLILYLLRNIIIHRNDFYIVSSIFLIIGTFFLIGFFYAPILPLDGINLIQIWSLIIGFISFLVFSIITHLYGKKKSFKNSMIVLFPRKLIKRVAIVIGAVIILVLVPLFISLGPVINLNNTAVWTEQQWLRKIQREIQWSRECAGLDMFEERPIENFTKSSTTSDTLMVSQIRQFDQDFAVQYLAASIGSTFEGLADSDIVYINNKEYWVAPKTVRFSEIAGDAVQTNTELYDHVEGFLAIDTFSGNLVNVSTTFNISENYPIFFGESESSRFRELTLGYASEGGTGAYDSDILLNTGWELGIPNNQFIYEGEPDGSLSGLEAFWKCVNIGLFAYAFQDSHDFVINRNVKTRVRNILLPQLKIDYDPYLVFNMEKGKLFYAVSIYTQIKMFSYSKVPILRFLGICLVDVRNGEMTFYKNPNLDTKNDPTYPLWEIYTKNSIYNWQEAPDWLKEQLRYPENLFEKQLEANYIYHVQNPTTWRRADDFHERPEDGDLFYIETDLGEGIEYVGLDLVEYKGKTAILLAGVYIVRHGVHFGEAIFYYTRESSQNFIGPKTARETYVSKATQEISLISGARSGNTLIYPLSNSIYYYIPTYSTAGSLQQLKLAGFVEAFTREVGYGENAIQAYNALNITGEVPANNLSLFYDFDMESEIIFPNDPAKFIIELQNLETNFSAPNLDIQVNLIIYTAATNNANYTIILPPDLYPVQNFSYINGDFEYYNFTIIDTTLYFGEGITLTGFLNTNKGSIILFYRWTLIVDGTVVYESMDEIILVIQ